MPPDARVAFLEYLAIRVVVVFFPSEPLPLLSAGAQIENNSISW
jgi:hypothetical protein